MTITPIRPATVPPVIFRAPVTHPAFCDGTCENYINSSNDDGSRYHGSAFAAVEAVQGDRGEGVLSVSATRFDTPGESSVSSVHLLAAVGDHLPHDEWTLTAGNARRLAAHLLNASDMIDGLVTR